MGCNTWRVSWAVVTRGGHVDLAREGRMEGTANLMVYHNGEIIRNTHEGVSFAYENPFLFVVSCTMMFMEL
ncbi:hypothetical protein AHAS_Ahas02G0100300 [Arachis hypogaea]